MNIIVLVYLVERRKIAFLWIFTLEKFKFMLRAGVTRYWYVPRLTPLSYAPVGHAHSRLNKITSDDPKTA
jgi:hypothetical protein